MQLERAPDTFDRVDKRLMETGYLRIWTYQLSADG